jgi:hypothetical protein
MSTTRGGARGRLRPYGNVNKVVDMGTSGRVAAGFAATALLAPAVVPAAQAGSGPPAAVARATARADAYTQAWRGRYAGTAGQPTDPARCLRLSARLVVCDVAFVVKVAPGDQLRRCRAFVLVPEPRGKITRSSADCREVVAPMPVTA